MPRVYLSPPHMSGHELELVNDAFASNWIAPLGPHVDAFEREFAAAVGVPHAAALSSGTAALHLAIKLAGVERGDEVLCSTFTFSATANAVTYEGGVPVFVYRLSNVLAAIGRGQLRVLAERVAARRRNFARYVELLGDLPGVEFMPEPAWAHSTRWLTCITIDPKAFGATREDVRLALEAENIESRPLWKPMHMQPVFASCRVRGGAVSAALFEHGLCLPSGSELTDAELERVAGLVRGVCRA